MRKLLIFVEELSLAIAVICVAAIMFIVSCDAFARYALHSPLPWAFELITYYLMIATVYFALSSTFRNGDHINIDLFRVHIPPVLRSRLDAVWSLLAAVIFAIMTDGAWEELTRAYEQKEFLPGYIAWPAWVSYAPIVIGCAIMTLRLVLYAYMNLVHGKDTDVIEHGEPTE